MVSSKVVKIKPGDVVRVWNVDDVGTLTIGGFSMTVAGHNNYDETGRWTGYTYGEGSAVYQGPAGLFRGTLMVENSLGGPGASGQWSAGTPISGQGLVLIKSVDKIVRYEEEHAYCKEVSNPTVFPARGGTRTARYIPYVTQTPVYQKENTYKDADTGETVVKIEGTEEVRTAEAKVVAQPGVNVSFTAPANTSGKQQAHTMYTCPDCGFVITGTQEADDSEGDWISVGVYRIPAGAKLNHLTCAVTATPVKLTNDGGNVLVNVERNGESVPLFEECERQVNTKTGASRSVLLGVIEDTDNAFPVVSTNVFTVAVGANTTGADVTVEVYRCADCGATASVLQCAEGDPGTDDEITSNPDPVPVVHRCAGGVFYGQEPIVSVFDDEGTFGGVKVREPSSAHKDVL